MRPNAIYLIILMASLFGCNSQPHQELILIKGGTFANTHSQLFGKGVQVSDFYMSRYEVTQSEWTRVMGNNPSVFTGEDLPVESVSWYDCIAYCNQRSLQEGLVPYYSIDKSNSDPKNLNDLDSVKWIVQIEPNANGYRLPTEVEWEYAASGGLKSKNFQYSGSDEIREVAWFWRNAGQEYLTGDWFWTNIENNECRPHPVGQKTPNELGIYDMSGNVREWCEEWYQDRDINIGLKRAQRGGGWIGGEYRCEVSNRHHFDANGKGPDQGFRVCRSVSSQALSSI